MAARNIKFRRKENLLIMTVDLSKSLWVSSKGKSQNITIATSGGKLDLWDRGQPDPNGVQVNINVFRPMTFEEKQMDPDAFEVDEEKP